MTCVLYSPLFPLAPQLLALSCTAYNPIIYAFLNHKFRDNVKCYFSRWRVTRISPMADQKPCHNRSGRLTPASLEGGQSNTGGSRPNSTLTTHPNSTLTTHPNSTLTTNPNSSLTTQPNRTLTTHSQVVYRVMQSYELSVAEDEF